MWLMTSQYKNVADSPTVFSSETRTSDSPKSSLGEVRGDEKSVVELN
jgi:hypothetical protein